MTLSPNIDEALERFKLNKPSREDFVQSLTKAEAVISENEFDLQKFAAYYCK